MSQTKSQLLDATLPPAQAVGGLGAKIQALMQGARIRCAKATYDFSVLGGPQVAITLPGDVLPSGAIVLGGVVDVRKAVVGSGASVALSIQSANDIISAAAVSGAPWSTTGLKAVVPDYTAAAGIKATAARPIVATVSAAVLTAGIFDVYLLYIAPTLATLDD